jgi:hypothetical protein
VKRTAAGRGKIETLFFFSTAAPAAVPVDDHLWKGQARQTEKTQPCRHGETIDS